jgi:hypothetical protein
MPQFLKSTPLFPSWQAGVSKLNCNVAIASQSSSTPSILILLALDPRYIASGRPQKKTPFPNNSSIVIEMCLPFRCTETQLFYCCVRLHISRNLFTESLPSNEHLIWLHYSGFQASCHHITLHFEGSHVGHVGMVEEVLTYS